MGFLPAAAVPAAAGAGPAAPIVIGAAAIGGAIAKLFSGASQRAADEKKSDPWLQEAVDSVYILKNQASAGKITKQKAAEIFADVIKNYVAKIQTLKTKSVVESRKTNQVRDLQALFEKEMSSVPESAADRAERAADPDAYFAPQSNAQSAGGISPALLIVLGLVGLYLITKD